MSAPAGAPPPTPPMPPTSSTPPTPPPRRPRRMSLLGQIALGFFAPGLLVVVFLVGVELSGRTQSGGVGPVTYLVWLAAVAALSVGLWWWSGRHGWRGIRAGILLFGLLLVALVAWGLYAGMHVLTHAYGAAN